MAVSGKEKFFARNTLSVLLIAMTNRFVYVETKNESTICGTLQHCDGYGNIMLSNAKLTTLKGKKIKADEMHVKSSSIRYVHLPDDVDPLHAVKTELSRKKRPLQMPAKYKKI